MPLCFHICWRYGPLLQRPILLFTSAHSKLVKRAIVQSCFSNALERSCEHVSKASLLAQSKHLEEAGHPCPSLVSVARAMCRKRKTYSCQWNSGGGRCSSFVLAFRSHTFLCSLSSVPLSRHPPICRLNFGTLPARHTLPQIISESQPSPHKPLTMSSAALATHYAGCPFDYVWNTCTNPHKMDAARDVAVV